MARSYSSKPTPTRRRAPTSKRGISRCQPAAMFFVNDVQSEYDRLKGLGVKFTMPPSKVTGSTIAMLDDTCGNLIQIAALDRR